jgi:hypothetical protein
MWPMTKRYPMSGWSKSKSTLVTFNGNNGSFTIWKKPAQHEPGPLTQEQHLDSLECEAHLEWRDPDPPLEPWVLTDPATKEEM